MSERDKMQSEGRVPRKGFVGKILIIGNPDTEKRLRDEIVLHKGASLGPSIAPELNDEYKTRGIPLLSDFVKNLADNWHSSARTPEEDYTVHRWKMVSQACGFEITSEWACIKAIAGAPEHIANNDQIPPAAWELCRQFQKIDAKDLYPLANAVNVHPYTFRNIQVLIKDLIRPPDPNPCTCEPADLQPLGECLCEAGRRKRLAKLGL